MLEGVTAASLSGLKVPEHEAAHFDLLPRLRMNGIAHALLCTQICLLLCWAAEA
jgi:hypothetical protein